MEQIDIVQPKCRSCGQPVKWVTTKKGKKMPVNLPEVNILPDRSGNVLAVTEDGEVIRGRQVGDSHEGGYWIAYISHFATCPNANQHRKG